MSDLTRKQKGDIAEIKAMEYLYRKGYGVYRPVFDNGPLDLIAEMDGALYRISVKYSGVKGASGKWQVGLRTVSRRKDNKMAVKNFDGTQYDILLVYIGPEDRVVEIFTAGLSNRSQLDIT